VLGSAAGHLIAGGQRGAANTSDELGVVLRRDVRRRVLRDAHTAGESIQLRPMSHVRFYHRARFCRATLSREKFCCYFFSFKLPSERIQNRKTSFDSSYCNLRSYSEMLATQA